MSFVFKIDDAYHRDGSRVLYGRLQSGVMHASQMIGLPTTLSLDIVATINFMRTGTLGLTWLRKLDVPVEVYLVNCWLRPDLIRREHAEFTLFPQSRAVDEWLRRYVREHGSASVYSE